MSDTIQARALAAAKEIFGPTEGGVWFSEEECADLIAKHFQDLDALRSAAEGALKTLVKSKALISACEDFDGNKLTEPIREIKDSLTALRAALSAQTSAQTNKQKE